MWFCAFKNRKLIDWLIDCFKKSQCHSSARCCSVLLCSLSIHPHWAPSCCVISPPPRCRRRPRGTDAFKTCLFEFVPRSCWEEQTSLLLCSCASQRDEFLLSPCQTDAGLRERHPQPGERPRFPPRGPLATIRLHSRRRPLWCSGWRRYSSCVCVESRIYTNPPEPPLSPPPPPAAPPPPAPHSRPSEKAIGDFICCQWKLLLLLEHDEEKRGVAESCPVGSGADTVLALAASRSRPPHMIFWHLFTARPRPNHPPQRMA